MRFLNQHCNFHKICNNVLVVVVVVIVADEIRRDGGDGWRGRRDGSDGWMVRRNAAEINFNFLKPQWYIIFPRSIHDWKRRKKRKEKATRRKVRQQKRKQKMWTRVNGIIIWDDENKRNAGRMEKISSTKRNPLQKFRHQNKAEKYSRSSVDD